MAENYYTLLKVPRDAPVEDIEDALRVERMKWSRRVNNAPRAADRHEAEERVELLGAVKGVLTDPARRAHYDQTLGLNHANPIRTLIAPPIQPILLDEPPPKPPNPPPDPPAPHTLGWSVAGLWWLPTLLIPLVGAMLSWSWASIGARRWKYARTALMFFAGFVIYGFLALPVPPGCSLTNRCPDTGWDYRVGLGLFFWIGVWPFTVGNALVRRKQVREEIRAHVR